MNPGEFATSSLYPGTTHLPCLTGDICIHATICHILKFSVRDYHKHQGNCSLPQVSRCLKRAKLSSSFAGSLSPCKFSFFPSHALDLPGCDNLSHTNHSCSLLKLFCVRQNRTEYCMTVVQYSSSLTAGLVPCCFFMGVPKVSRAVRFYRFGHQQNFVHPRPPPSCQTVT